MLIEQYFVKESSAIVSSTFETIIQDKETDIVIIPGDLTKNGENESHTSALSGSCTGSRKAAKGFML